MMPILSAGNLRQRAGRWFAQVLAAGQCHSCSLSLGSSSSPEPLQMREGGVENERGRWERGEGQEEGSGQWESSLGVVPPTTPPGGDRPLSVLVVAVSPSPHSSCSLSPGPCLWEKGREKKGKVVGDILKEELKVANRWL